MRGDEHLFLLSLRRRKSGVALFRKYTKGVLIGSCKATGNFIVYVISTVTIYALLTEHEVKKLDILRFMDRKFPIVFTLICGGVLRDETKSAGRQSKYGFRGPSGTFPGDTPRVSLPRIPAWIAWQAKERLRKGLSQGFLGKVLGLWLLSCERKCSSAWVGPSWVRLLL